MNRKQRIVAVLAALIALPLTALAGNALKDVVTNTILVKESTANGGTYFAKILVPNLSASYTLTLPADDGNLNELLSTNGSGTLSWVSALINPMDSAGDMIYGGALGVATKLDSGTDGKWLVSGGAAAPSWTSTTKFENADTNVASATGWTYKRKSSGLVTDSFGGRIELDLEDSTGSDLPAVHLQYKWQGEASHRSEFSIFTTYAGVMDEVFRVDQGNTHFGSYASGSSSYAAFDTNYLGIGDDFNRLVFTNNLANINNPAIGEGAWSIGLSLRDSGSITQPTFAIYHYLAGAAAMTINKLGGVKIVETTGEGNVPHACTRQVSSTSTGVATKSLTCSGAGEIVTGGGCLSTNALFRNLPSSSNTWSCGASTAGSNPLTAYAICCVY